LKTELHIHAKEILEENSPEEILRKYKENGYQAIVVTDHFRRKDFEKNGLTLNDFFRPYAKLAQIANDFDIAVLPGAELDHGGHFLIYGLGLNDFSELATIRTFSKILDHIHKCKGIIIQTHALRKKLDLYWHQLNLNADGYEIMNGSGLDDNSEKTAMIADLLNGVKTVGSDAHCIDTCCQLYMDIRFSSYEEFVPGIKNAGKELSIAKLKND